MDKDFSSLIFDKPLTKLAIKDVQRYFQTPRTESDKLEFKSYPEGLNASATKELERKILKTICAFLNSDGGILIWGAPEGIKMTGQKEEVYQGALTSSIEYHQKDAFISKIANRIIPSPRGVLFHRIEDNGKYVYLFEVPASQYAPHQFENMYSMRMDGQTVAAPHHYIEALFRKVTFPNLECYLRIDGYRFDNSNKHSRLSCTVLFRNISRYQNDLNLHCRIITPIGLIVKENGNYLHLNNGIQGGSNIEFNIANVIHYGNFLEHPFDIILDRSQLHHGDYAFTMAVTFGAQYSPMKICTYLLKVGPNFPEKKQAAIVEKNENRYFHENEQISGLTDQEVVEMMLNR